ncbi:MAG: hypothetical protein CME61_05750 [Halobacteriovoraceae bacterium]|nr:hypothetical protein [Halobacteriovoraceae bacterium]
MKLQLHVLIILFLIFPSIGFGQISASKWSSPFYKEKKNQELLKRVLKKSRDNALIRCMWRYRMQTSLQHKACVRSINYSIGTFNYYQGKFNKPSTKYKRKNFVDIYFMALEECKKSFDHDRRDPFWTNPSQLKACRQGAKHILDSVFELSINIGLHGEGRLKCDGFSCVLN